MNVLLPDEKGMHVAMFFLLKKTMDRNIPILIEAWDETGMLQEESDKDEGGRL